MVQTTELDEQVDGMRLAVERFEKDIQTTLESRGIWKRVGQEFLDLMPREEVFLISSFYLNIKQIALHITSMLEQTRQLVEKCQERNRTRRLYAPRIAWRSWLYTGGGEDQDRVDAANPTSLETRHREDAADDKDESDEEVELPKIKLQRAKNIGSQKPSAHPSTSLRVEAKRDMLLLQTFTIRARKVLSDSLDNVQNSRDVHYAFKVAVAAFLVLWPAFVAPWNTWFSLERGREWALFR